MKFEQELVPYEDFPESDELLVELESPEEDTRSQFWENQRSSTIPTVSSDHHYFKNDSQIDDKLTGDSSDTLRGMCIINTCAMVH